MDTTLIEMHCPAGEADGAGPGGCPDDLAGVPGTTRTTRTTPPERYPAPQTPETPETPETVAATPGTATPACSDPARLAAESVSAAGPAPASVSAQETTDAAGV